MTTWVTHAEAAELVGCATSTIEAHLGEFNHRLVRGSVPSIDRESVQEWGKRWHAAREARVKPARVDESAPDDGDVWLRSAEAGAVLGWTPQYVTRLATQGRIPATRRGRRWWLRRDDVERYSGRIASAADRRGVA